MQCVNSPYCPCIGEGCEHRACSRIVIICLLPSSPFIHMCGPVMHAAGMLQQQIIWMLVLVADSCKGDEKGEEATTGGMGRSVWLDLVPCC